MCKFCERQTPIGWNQPSLENVNGNIMDEKSEFVIHDYQTSTPELIIKLPTLAKSLWGSGFCTIYIPIHYCPVCGTCKWNAYDKQFKDFVCVNAGSKYCADFITYKHKCE